MNELTKKLLISAATSVVPIIVKGTVSGTKTLLEKKRKAKEPAQLTALYDTVTVEYVDIYTNTISLDAV